MYAYANSRGCDGSRLYFDGASVIAVNGNIVQSSNQFSLNEVDVVSASIDLGEVDSFRTPVPSRSMQSEENL